MVYQEARTLHAQLHGPHLLQEWTPVKYIFEKPVLNGRLSRWTLMLSEFDLKFIPLKVIKGKAVADFLAENPVSEHPTTDTWSLPDESILCTHIDA